MKKPSIQNFTIIIDSREQRPYTFQNIKPEPPETIIQGLTTGDYSVVGFESRICVERKSMADFFGSVGTGRQRFEREMERLSTFDYAAIVIESDIKTWFMNPPSRSKMNPRSVFRTIVAWSQRYNIYIWPMWDRQSAEKVTYLILKRYYDDYMKNLDK
jgi:ERCC4-type nuclease